MKRSGDLPLSTRFFMPLTVSCSSCKAPLSVGDNLVGKKVKCPKCSQVVTIPGAKPAPALAGTPARSSAAPPSPAAIPAAAPDAVATISVACAGCKKKLHVKAALAGKAVKCPGCGQAVRIPAAKEAPSGPAVAPPPPLPPTPAAADDEDEWMDVNEAAAPPPAAAGGAAPGTGDRGEGILEPLELPPEMLEQFRNELAANERIVWADRPQQDILMHQASQLRKTGLILGLAVGLGLPGLGIVFLLLVKTVIPLIVMSVFALLFVAVAVYLWGEPERRRRNAPKRGCYVLTNRRVLLHPGLAARALMGRTAFAEASLGAGANARVMSYSGLELGRMSRSEMKKFENCGSLCFSRDLLDRPLGVGLSALKDVREVERKIRQQLLDPIIDKILRGEKLDKDDKGDEKGKDGGEETELLPPDENIKDFVSSKSGAAGKGDANIKEAKSSIAGSVEQAPPELRHEVEAELTAGERVLWIGVPEGKTKGRGFIGALTGAEHRYEPDYYLYAITNRRVMLFAEKGSKDSQAAMFGGGSDTQGPTTYYPPHLLRSGLEQDNRIPGGGGIVFKKVKRVIVTESTSSGYRRGAGGHRGRMIKTRTTKSSTRIEMHHFGILRIRNHLPVALLMYETLIAPLRTR
jgi:hypothetical protein